MRTQVFRANGQGLAQSVWITQEVGGAIKLCSQPFVWVEDDAIKTFHALPHCAELWANHRRAGPSRVKMGVQTFAFRNVRDFV